jgi:hypothetical protein
LRTADSTTPPPGYSSTCLRQHQHLLVPPTCGHFSGLRTH